MPPLATANPPLRNWIDATAYLYALPSWNLNSGGTAFTPGQWLEGLLLTENSGTLTGRRYEKHHDLIADGDRPAVDDGAKEDDASYGPMQVLATNVKIFMGLQEDFPLPADWTFLYDWLIGCGFGMKVLRAELQVTGNQVARALARYNGGPRGELIDLTTGKMRRQDYVDKVQRWSLAALADRQRQGWVERVF